MKKELKIRIKEFKAISAKKALRKWKRHSKRAEPIEITAIAMSDFIKPSNDKGE